MMRGTFPPALASTLLYSTPSCLYRTGSKAGSVPDKDGRLRHVCSSCRCALGAPTWCASLPIVTAYRLLTEGVVAPAKFPATSQSTLTLLVSDLDCNAAFQHGLCCFANDRTIKTLLSSAPPLHLGVQYSAQLDPERDHSTTGYRGRGSLLILHGGSVPASLRPNHVSSWNGVLVPIFFLRGR